MKKIVIIGPNAGMGGVERASTNIANGLTDLGYIVTYLALIPEKPFFNLNSKYLEPVGFNIKSINFIRTLKFIRKEIIRIQPDAILCYTKFYAALSNLALIHTQYRIYITERSSPFYQWPIKIEMICKISFFLKKPKGVVSQTSLASQYHQKYYGKTKYTVIPNAIKEIKRYPEIPRENIILAVGRFQDPCKGFDLLVKSFNLLKNEDWKLVFAGGSQEEGQYLLNLSSDAKKSRIEFLGAIKDMDKLYSKVGIFVMPSRSEGFPNALAEALSAGCCCVSFDFTAGPRDLINQGVNGEIVEAENIQALALTIDRLIIDTKRSDFYRDEAVKVAEKLSEKNISKHILEFITN